MIKCYCGKEYKDKRVLSIHINRKKDNLSKLDKEKIIVELIYGKGKVENSINRYIKKEVSIKCLKNEGIDLSKYITLLGIKRTSKQERSTERYKNKIKNSIFEKYGVDNISKSEEYKKKKSETVMKNYGVKHNFLVKETKDKAKKGRKRTFNNPELKKKMQEKCKQTCQDKYGVDNVAKDENIKQKNAKKQKERCASMTIEEKRKMTEQARLSWNQQNSWVSKIELRIRNILQKMKIKFKTNETLFNYNYDIVVGNTLIEINGDFWHGNPLFFEPGEKLFETLTVDEVWKKDRIKKETAENNGKKVYVLWENEINKYTDEELEQILSSWL